MIYTVTSFILNIFKFTALQNLKNFRKVYKI